MNDIVSKRTVQKAGVYEADAPDGYVALVVYGFAGRRLLRLEVAADCYSCEMVQRLEGWLKRWSKAPLSIVR